MKCRSEWHKPAATVRTRTSRGPTLPISTSSITRSPGMCSRIAAFTDGTLAPAQERVEYVVGGRGRGHFRRDLARVLRIRVGTHDVVDRGRDPGDVALVDHASLCFHDQSGSSIGDAPAVFILVREQGYDNQRRACRERAEHRARTAVAHDQRGTLEHDVLIDPRLDVYVGRRLTKARKVEVTADREQHAH